MRSIFKRSNDQNSTLTRKIPDFLFNENSNFHIDSFSRLTPKFEEMLKLQYARQMFQKFLRTHRLHDVFQLFLELSSVTTCGDDCNFFDYCLKTEVVDVINYLRTEDTVSADFNKELERFLDEYGSMENSDGCAYVRLYRRYISSSCYNHQDTGPVMFIKETQYWVTTFLAEIFLRVHNERLPSLDKLQQLIGDNLRDVWYPQYLQSNFQQKYQLQLLNSGLNALRLSDFIYSDDYLMLITEFLDNEGLCPYLLFLLAVKRLPDSSDKCSFQDALDIYSKFLVMDSDSFLDVPSTIANIVVNNICQHAPESVSACVVDVGAAFRDAFNPVYLFLEQFWLPQFLVSDSYQTHLSSLKELVEIYQRRVRMYSDVTPQPSGMRPCEVVISEDNTSDISIDNASVHSEPTISTFEASNNKPGSSSWWPPLRLDNRLASYQSRPMTLGSFDDLGRYQSINSAVKNNSSVNKSTSSEILSTINELSNDILSRVQFNSHNHSRTVAQSPDDVARQIINDIHQMTLRNL